MPNKTVEAGALVIEMYRITSFSALVTALALTASAGASAQTADLLALSPFAVGRAVAQVERSVMHCGGRLGPIAQMLRTSAIANNAAEFKRGFLTGHADIEGRELNLGGRAQLCGVSKTTYGPIGVLPGLWDD
jgi:hypothetical protein